jgi:hypothetical protein
LEGCSVSTSHLSVFAFLVTKIDRPFYYFISSSLFLQLHLINTKAREGERGGERGEG